MSALLYHVHRFSLVSHYCFLFLVQAAWFEGFLSSRITWVRFMLTCGCRMTLHDHRANHPKTFSKDNQITSGTNTHTQNAKCSYLSAACEKTNMPVTDAHAHACVCHSYRDTKDFASPVHSSRRFWGRTIPTVIYVLFIYSNMSCAWIIKFKGIWVLSVPLLLRVIPQIHLQSRSERHGEIMMRCANSSTIDVSFCWFAVCVVSRHHVLYKSKF